MHWAKKVTWRGVLKTHMQRNEELGNLCAGHVRGIAKNRKLGWSLDSLGHHGVCIVSDYSEILRRYHALPDTYLFGIRQDETPSGCWRWVTDWIHL